VLGKRPKTQQPSWISNNTLHLIEAQGKAKAVYKKSQLEIDKKAWRELQNQVSAAYAQDQTNYEESQLKALELADQKHEHGKVWKIIDMMTKKPQEAAASKVRSLDSSIQ
jgi:hypothetical protein